MSVSLFFVVTGYWICLVLRDLWLAAGFSGIWLLYLAIRIRRKTVCAAWILLAALALCQGTETEQIPQPGEYRICDVRSGYSLATDGQSTVLFQDEETVIHDKVLIEAVEPLEGLRNLGVFDFAEYMEEHGVSCRGSGRVTETGSSLQAAVMRWCRPSAARMAAFCNIRDTPTLLDRAGLPVIAFLMIMETVLRRRMAASRVRTVSTILGLIWGWLFCWPVSLTRWVLFRLIRFLYDDRLGAWSLSVFLFLLLLPARASSFSLVFPALLQLCSIVRRPKDSRLVLLFLQALYFGSFSPVSLLGFGLLKMAAAASFVLAWFDVSLIPELILPEIPLYVPGFLAVAAGWVLLRILLEKARPVSFVPWFMLMMTWPWLDPCFHVYMLDVGQGDCTVITEPFMKSAVMIDAPGNLYRDNADRIILPFLKSIGVRKLDALIVSHEDYDHAGAVEAVCSRLPVEKVIRDPHDRIPVDYPMMNLLPDRKSQDENEGSLLTYFQYDGNTWLWPGDAGQATEKQLMETLGSLPVTVLKAGHHGSASASSPAFLDWIRPMVTLISAGRHNRYGHPSPEVISSLQSLNIPRFSTAQEGMIHLFSWHGFLFLETAAGTITWLQP